MYNTITVYIPFLILNNVIRMDPSLKHRIKNVYMHIHIQIRNPFKIEFYCIWCNNRTKYYIVLHYICSKSKSNVDVKINIVIAII